MANQKRTAREATEAWARRTMSNKAAERSLVGAITADDGQEEDDDDSGSMQHGASGPTSETHGPTAEGEPQ